MMMFLIGLWVGTPVGFVLACLFLVNREEQHGSRRDG